jgi:predicted nucleic acid-binding protein
VPAFALAGTLVRGARKTLFGPEDEGGARPGDLPEEVFRAASFPPLSIDEEWQRIIRSAEAAERAARIPGLRDFLIAAAHTESRGIPGAINDDPREAKRALGLLCDYKVNYETRFLDNPWRPEPCEGSRLSKRWAYTGGPQGLMPVTALSTHDKVGRDMDPARVFDVPFAAAFTADLVYRLRTKWGAVNWARARAGMNTHTLAKKPLSNPTRKAIHERFMEAIRETKGFGVDQKLHLRGVSVRRYPGFAAVLRATLQADGRI